MGERRNRVGAAYALTVFAPIARGDEEQACAAPIEALPIGRRQPARAARRRCTSRASRSFRELVHQGPQQRHRDHAASGAPGVHEHVRRRPRPVPRRAATAIAPRPTPGGATAPAIPGTRDGAAFAPLDSRPPDRHRACSPPPIPSATVADVRESLALREQRHRLRRRRAGPRRRRLQRRASATDAADARGQPAEPSRDRRSAARAADDRPRRHPGQRPARLHVSRAPPTCSCAIDDVERARALMRAHAAAGGDRRAVARRAAADRDARRVHVRRAARRWGCRTTMLASFPDEFREGMAARAERLGDRGPSAPEHWEPGLGTGEAHVLVTVYAVDDERLDDARARRCDGVGAARRDRRSSTSSAPRRSPGGTRPLRLLRRDRAAGGRRQRRGAAARRRPARRRAAAGATWRPASSCSATSDEDGALPDGAGRAVRPQRDVRRLPQAARWTSPRSGAYVERRRELPGRPGAARGQDRRPLARRHAARALARPARTPRSPPTRRASTTSRYADDPDGLRCPLGAHIRRANPRDAAASSTAGSPTATASSAAAAPTARRCPRASTEDDGVGSRPGLRLLQRRASGASSRPSRRSGSTTATRSASAPTRTS